MIRKKFQGDGLKIAELLYGTPKPEVPQQEELPLETEKPEGQKEKDEQ